MDIPTLAASAIALLAPYVAKGTEAFASEVGKTAFEGVGRVLALVKGKLAGRGSEALADLEAAPDSEDNRADLRKQLAKTLAADPAFADELQALVREVEAKGGAPVTQMLKVGDGGKGSQIAGSNNIVNM